MRRISLMVTIGILISTTPACAFDPTRTEIIGLHLGMAKPEAVLRLEQQGFSVIQAKNSLSAKTRDGQLTIELAQDVIIRQLRYTFNGKGAGEPDKITASMDDRFGPPDQVMPTAWCRRLGNDGRCPSNSASLTFLPDTLTMILSAGILSAGTLGAGTLGAGTLGAGTLSAGAAAGR